MDENQLISVGIDIGTSTTQLVFSKITFKNQASVFSVPNIEIDNKEVLYKSKIYFTPLINEEVIDFDKIVEIVDCEYRQANINKEDIDIGAIIITGESARKHNSNEVINLLSEYAGDFVVASAGVDLESVIAGKGAGADLMSREHHETLVHIDIGGGTSNYVVFDQGDVIDTGCLDIGGRLIKLDANGIVYHMTNKAQELIKRHNLDIELNKKLSEKSAIEFCNILVEAIETSLGLNQNSEDFNLLITNKSINLPLKIDSISYSGGISEYIYNEFNGHDLFKYNDIGIILAAALKNSTHLKQLKRRSVLQTLSATVVGAGSHTTKLSGSTIYCDSDNLPLKNVSIVKLSQNDISDISNISNIIKQRVDWYDYKEAQENVAIAFSGQSFYSFEDISNLASEIVSGISEYLSFNKTLIVIMENDYAKALGFSIKPLLNQDIDLISLDNIVVNQGDYIDIGKPILDNQVLPVIVKTIVFN